MISENDTPTVQPADIDLLIVDDETDFRESARRYFFKIGFRVDEAEDGEEALNVSTSKKPSTATTTKPKRPEPSASVAAHSIACSTSTKSINGTTPVLVSPMLLVL